ncbi:MAG: carboxypeptidase-like regulatory domain-containing protein [Candidatus Microbacterium colombiense]|nr:MAG: carboxypeptidase-like regulatory domain-containing protein [Microbacterium sp.]
MISAVLILVGGGALPAAADADDLPATISGTVTREDDGTPVEGVGVFISSAEGGFSFNGYTDASGDYIVADLPVGEYVVRFAPDGAAPDLVSEYWNAATDWSSAERISAVSGETVAGIDASLQLGGSISGSVTRESDGSPVEGTAVEVYPTDGSWGPGLVWSQADGSFTSANLRAGEYTVRFDAPAGSGLTGEYWDDASDVADASTVTVVAGGNEADVDAALAESAVISGQVTRESDGSPVEGLVEVWREGEFGGERVNIEPDGSYRAEVAPGSYALHFVPADDRLFAEYWDDASVIDEATAVTVVSGEQRSAIDAALAAGTAITGVVRAGGEPVADISVIAFDGAEPAGFVSTAEDGSYSITLPTGTYVLEASASVANPIYATEFYENAATRDEATALTLGADADLTGVDIDLDLGADIRGNVALDGVGAPGGEGAVVTAYRWNGEDWAEVLRAPSWGAFAFSADPSRNGGPLPAGRYTFSVAAPGYCTQYFGGATALDEAKWFDLAPGDTRTGEDMTLTDECEGSEPKPALKLSAASIRAGGDITVSGTGFTAGATLSFELHSDPIVLGSLTADAGGAVKGSLRIPASAPVGTHTLVALSGTTVIASTALTVTAAPSTGGAADPADPADPLASTGGEFPGFAVMAAFGLVVLGLALVRRRRAQV